MAPTVCQGTGQGRNIWSPTFRAFADYWDFEPRLYRPYPVQTNGKVESGVKDIRSAEIVPLPTDYFKGIAFKGYGRSPLHGVMEGIDGNFVPGDPIATEWLEWLSAIEDHRSWEADWRTISR